MTHTSGTWKQESILDKFDNLTLAISSDGTYICQMFQQPELDYNACLISAAPDLLKALTDLLDEFESRTALIETCDLDDTEIDAMENARIAIAKAKGE